VAADKLTKIQKDLDETKVILHQTIDSVLRRGEKLDSLVDKSADLSLASQMFYKQVRGPARGAARGGRDACFTPGGVRARRPRRSPRRGPLHTHRTHTGAQDQQLLPHELAVEAGGGGQPAAGAAGSRGGSAGWLPAAAAAGSSGRARSAFN
jgi:hypothetical protein